ncbi:MAG: hypothetical protein ACLGI3_09460 [Actinomycetes bacterium]
MAAAGFGRMTRHRTSGAQHVLSSHAHEAPVRAARPGQGAAERMHPARSADDVHAGRTGVWLHYQDSYRLCYVRGPRGTIVALAEQIG